MRIGIDGRALTGRYAGDRTYWLNLLRAHLEAAERDPSAAHHYIVYTRLPVPPGDLPESRFLTLRTVPATNDRIWTALSFPNALAKDEVDLAHTHYISPMRIHCPVVTTVQEISYRIYPEWFPRKNRMLLNSTVPGAMRRARIVITVSESSRRDILRVYGLPPERVVAIPMAAAPEYAPIPHEVATEQVRERLNLTGPYVLFVGVLQPRKNLPLLLEAFAWARQSLDAPHQLVLAGKRGWGYENLTIQAAKLHIADRLHITDYVADADLPYLYSATDAMTFPSLYEGFGLPPLEAMACGAPTLVSDAPAMPEIVGDGAWKLPVMDYQAWGKALGRLISDPEARTFWSERGIERAAEYSWERTAALTRSAYRKAVDC